MKRSSRYFLPLLIIMSFTPVIGLFAEPAWVGVSKKDNVYFYSKGYAEDTGSLDDVKVKAFQKAKAGIADYIFEETSVEKVLTSSGGLGDNEELRKTYTETVKSSSSVNLSGVDIDDVYNEKTEDSGLAVYRVWVLAKIKYTDLEMERKRILDLLQRQLALVDDNLNASGTFIDRGNITEGIEAYLAAAAGAMKVKERSGEIPIYISRAVKLLDNIVIEASDNPAQVDTLKGGVFRFNVSYSRTGMGKIPLPGVKVSFLVKNNNGDYQRSGIVLTGGMAECRIKSLREVKADNVIKAVLSMDFSEKYLSLLRDARDRAGGECSFRTVSKENMAIPVSVLSMYPELTAGVRDYLIGEGYSVVNLHPSELEMQSLMDENPDALKAVSGKGVRRILLISAKTDKPVYNRDIERYLGIYSLTARFIDTLTGEILSSKNIKLSVTSSEESGIPGAFIRSAGKEIKKMID
ncbi:MAG: hypothetical protein ABSG94_08795 [Brevinematales bacterium]